MGIDKKTLQKCKKVAMIYRKYAHIIARIWLASFYHLTVNLMTMGILFNNVIIYILKYRMTV